MLLSIYSSKVAMNEQMYSKPADYYKENGYVLESSPVMPISGVYVIHFDQALDRLYENAYRHGYGDLQHYVGESQDVLTRWNAHLFGQGSKKTVYAVKNNIRFVLAAIFPMPGSSKKDRLKAERSLSVKEHKDICLVCNQSRFNLEKRKGVGPEDSPSIPRRTNAWWYEWHKKNNTLRKSG